MAPFRLGDLNKSIWIARPDASKMPAAGAASTVSDSKGAILFRIWVCPDLSNAQYDNVWR
jgi:hypothetical protein